MIRHLLALWRLWLTVRLVRLRLHQADINQINHNKTWWSAHPSKVLLWSNLSGEKILLARKHVHSLSVRLLLQVQPDFRFEIGIYYKYNYILQYTYKCSINYSLITLLRTKIIYSLANGLSLSVRLEVTTTWLSMDLQKIKNYYFYLK